MVQPRDLRPAGIIALFLFLSLLCGSAAAEPEYSVTYTITVGEDGSALWRVEYRTLLTSEQDVADFTAYVNDLPAVYLPRFRTLMENSAAQAAAATGRPMTVSAVTGTGTTQTSPTGKFGVILYTLRWDGFCKQGQTMTIGDAFAGGLYLAKDNTLIIRYPDGYSVRLAEPAPDSSRDGLIWYGLRPFGYGEPRVVLERAGSPLLPVAVFLVLAILVAFTAFYLWHRRKDDAVPDDEPGPGLPPPQLSAAEIGNLEERIAALLAANGGEMFQSDIVKNLGLPKSTVSAAMSSLHAANRIQKVRKGRENLIRLV